MTAYEPSMLDIANFLDAAGCIDPAEEAPLIALWLVRQSPTALKLHAELSLQQEDQPTLLELASLLQALESTDAFPRCRPTALWLVQQSEIGRVQYQRLEELARDAGASLTSGVRLTTVLANHESFERLLAAGDDWNDPAEVLDPSGHVGVDDEALFHLCQARIARSEGQDRQRLEILRDKLRHCATARRGQRFPG